jgi:hypothetical protein
MNGFSGEQIEDEVGLGTRRFSMAISVGGKVVCVLFRKTKERGVFG